MKTTSLFWAAMAVSAGLLASCADIKEINDRLDEFDGRLTALETVTSNLNNNIETMQALYSGATINSATNDNGTWTIVLSNGETLTLTQGSIGVANPPVMSVDKEGYWMVDYDGKDGQEPEYIMNGENKVLATGTDGKTPIFGVDASGYWTVKYDAAATPEQILGADGHPVKALPEGGLQDPYFADVKMENGEFKVTLRSGEQLVIPVISDFLCAIECTGVQTFNAGQTKPYNVTIKGVKSTMITTPSGWTAVLSEPVGQSATLTVTAPVTTKAALADSRSDISILVLSTQGLATIAKMQVNLSDAPVVVNPIASVTAGAATQSTLAYSVAVSDVTSWMYIHQKSSESAPDAAKIAAEGTVGTESALVFEGLDPATEYALYVLPINGEKQGAVASGKNTTAKQLVASYYALYEAGETITIGGKEFSKEKNGQATVFASDGEITTNGVYFLKEGAQSTYKSGINAYMKLNGAGDGTGCVVYHNLIFDQSATSDQYACTVNFNESFPLMMFSNCTFKQNSGKPIFYISSAARNFTELIFDSCDFNVISAQPIINVSGSTATYGTYKVNNCVFYGDGSKKFNLFSGNTATCNEVVFTNNTIVNVLPNNSFFNFGTIKKATVTDNIFFANVSIDKDQALLNSAALEGETINNNICYTGQENAFVALTSGSTGFEGLNEFTKLSTNPFEGGTFNAPTFIPNATYASYGAKR